MSEEEEIKILTKETSREDFSVPDLSEEELRTFVIGVLDNSIYTDRHIQDVNMIPMVFMPIAMGFLVGLTEEQVRQIGCIYAEMKDAAPRSINRHPIFFHCKFLNQSDTERAWKVIIAEDERRKELKI